jgi:hypothetical protein
MTTLHQIGRWIINEEYEIRHLCHGKKHIKGYMKLQILEANYAQYGCSHCKEKLSEESHKTLYRIHAFIKPKHHEYPHYLNPNEIY